MYTIYIDMYTFRIYKRIYYIYWEMIYDTSWYIRDDDIYWGYTIWYIQLRMCSSHWQIEFPYIYADSHSLAMAHNTLHQAYTIQCPWSNSDWSMRICEKKIVPIHQACYVMSVGLERFNCSCEISNYVLILCVKDKRAHWSNTDGHFFPGSEQNQRHLHCSSEGM